MFLFGDRGLPSSVRHTNAYSGNTYKFSKADGSYHYVRIHILTNQGNHYFTNTEGATLAGTNPDHHIQDLQEAIKSGNFPTWDVCVQTIRPEEIVDAPVDIFDMTKIWPHKKYPLRKVGRMTLCKNPDNWFAEIEQAAFSPSNMVRGVEPSPDPILQARMFAYPDAARYRLGINYQFLPTNAAKSEVYCPIERDGFMNFTKNMGKTRITSARRSSLSNFRRLNRERRMQNLRREQQERPRRMWASMTRLLLAKCLCLLRPRLPRKISHKRLPCGN